MSIDNKLIFQDVGHKYFRVNEPDNLWLSVTSIVKQYSEPFKRDEWLAYKAFEKVLGEDAFKALKKDVNALLGRFDFFEVVERCYKEVNIDDFLVAKGQILKEWNEEGIRSAAKGTAGHYEFELASYTRGVEENLLNGIKYPVSPKPNFEYDNEQRTEHLIQLEDGYYPELIVGYEKDK